jgi:hypothetical protein
MEMERHREDKTEHHIMDHVRESIFSITSLDISPRRHLMVSNHSTHFCLQCCIKVRHSLAHCGDYSNVSMG